VTTPNDLHPARRLWQHLELLHGVTYFSDDFTAALKGIGLKGFWMSYFASRGAPLGAVGPGPIEATFYNFAPAMVRKAVPDAWRFAEPPLVLATRATAAAAVLRSIVPGIEAEAERIVPLLSSAVRSGRADGRTLFAANQQLPLPEDPVAALWQCATSLREHRGDGHVAMLVGYDVSGLEAHHLVVASGVIESDRLRSVRGWTEGEWNAGRDAVMAKGWVDPDGTITEGGAQLRDAVERRTDAIAMQPYADGLTEPGLDLLPSLLAPLSRAVVASGIMPFPNPIGLTPPE
jgi:hypothetical protein